MVRQLDNAIHGINLYPVDNAIHFPNAYPFEQLGLGVHRGAGGGVLPYMGYIGICRCEGYGFQAVYSRIGYINQSVWV